MKDAPSASPERFTASLEKCERCDRFAFPEGMVQLTLEQFEELRSKAALADKANETNYRRLSNTNLARHPAHAKFVVECLKTMTVTEAFEAFVEKFGEGLISRSQLYRFTQDIGYGRRG